MPTVYAYAAQADLEVAVGGADRLLQLADFARTGNINDSSVQATIVGWLNDGGAEVRAAAEVKHDAETLAALDAPSLRRLLDVNAALSARAAFEKGCGGLAMPEHLAARARRADEFLDQLADGHRRLGRVSGGKKASLSQPVGLVDPDPTGSGVSIAGFKLGFR